MLSAAPAPAPPAAIVCCLLVALFFPTTRVVMLLVRPPTVTLLLPSLTWSAIFLFSSTRSFAVVTFAICSSAPPVEMTHSTSLSTSAPASRSNVPAVTTRPITMHGDAAAAASAPPPPSPPPPPARIQQQPIARLPMGRYVELQHVRHGVDPESGLSFVGPASYFVSYAWDTPWDSLVRCGSI